MEQKKYILVVDDEPVTGRLLDSLLIANGYEVCLVANGREALEKIKVREPDLIISDVLMPEMDGYTFYKELKKNPAIANTPTIVLTARSKMEDTFAVLGVDEFLVKPFATEVLLERVQALIARGKVNTIAVAAPVLTPAERGPAPLPMGPIVIGGFIVLICLICFSLIRQMTTARINAASIGEKLKEDDANVLTEDQMKELGLR